MAKPTRVLGAVIAGGASRRFGSDKALTLIEGRPMLAHVLEALRPQVRLVVICGREWPGEASLFDIRTEKIGPLGGLEAALSFASYAGFDAVLSVPVDTLPLPTDLLERLQGERAAVFEHQHLIGYWPIDFLKPLQSYLAAGERHMGGWRRKAAARTVAEPHWIGNVNSPGDLADIQAVALVNRMSPTSAESHGPNGRSGSRAS